MLRRRTPEMLLTEAAALKGCRFPHGHGRLRERFLHHASCARTAATSARSATASIACSTATNTCRRATPCSTRCCGPGHAPCPRAARFSIWSECSTCRNRASGAARARRPARRPSLWRDTSRAYRRGCQGMFGYMSGRERRRGHTLSDVPGGRASRCRRLTAL